jgi:hypothetical protein
MVCTMSLKASCTVCHEQRRTDSRYLLLHV